jgi:hypothetical protein
VQSILPYFFIRRAESETFLSFTGTERWGYASTLICLRREDTARDVFSSSLRYIMFGLSRLAIGAVVASLFTATLTSSQYVSRPDIIPAEWNVTYTAPNANLSDGYFFLAQRVETPVSISIYTSTGDLVYWYTSEQITNASNGAFNFRPQMLNGEVVFTYWEGFADILGYGFGNAIIMASNYSTMIANVTATNRTDLHDQRITHTNQIVTTMYNTLSGVDTSSLENGAEGSYIEDGCFQLLDIPDSTPQFTFCSYEAGISIDESFLPIAAPPTSPESSWDYIHVNTISMDPIGNYLLSARHMHSLIYIDGQSGDILWRLGGKLSNFTGSGINFSWQHDAKFAYEFNTPAQVLQNQTTRYISIFDNASDGTENDQSASNGLIIEVDLVAMTATTVTNFTAPGGETDLLVPNQGSFQLMGSDEPSPASNNVVMGYGALPVIAEWDVNGTALQVIHFGTPAVSQSYRVYKAPWVGNPLTAPDVAIQNNTMYVSWNGATEVASWRIVQGSNTTQVPRSSFETVIPLDSSSTDMIQAIALDAKGTQLASSQMLMPDGTATGQGAVNGTPSTTMTSSTSNTPSGGSGSSDGAISFNLPIVLSSLVVSAAILLVGL